MKSTTDLCTIARTGATIRIPATKSTTDLCTIARAIGDSGGKLILMNCTKSTTDICTISRANSGNVVFEFEG